MFRGGGNSFHNLMIQMNGPRVIWGRLPELALGLFIIFKQTKISSPEDLFHHDIKGHVLEQKNISSPEDLLHQGIKGVQPDSGDAIEKTVWIAASNITILLSLSFSFVRVSWMVAEQIILSRQTQNGGPHEEQFVNWTFCRRARQQGEEIISIMV